MNYLWDTNIAVYYLQKQLPTTAEKFIDNILQREVPSFSVITEIELLCWEINLEEDLKVLKRFINDSFIFELSQPIKLKTADIRKTHKMKLPDAIIAATAIVNNLTLLTRNTVDFKNIDSLNFFNPWNK